jgi:hypothetical protein
MPYQKDSLTVERALPVFDGAPTPAAGAGAADAWAHYVHILSGQPPDAGVTSQARRLSPVAAVAPPPRAVPVPTPVPPVPSVRR